MSIHNYPLVVSFEEQSQFDYLCKRDDIDEYIIPLDCFSNEEIIQMISHLKSRSKKVVLRLPRIARPEISDKDLIKFLRLSIDGILIRNLDQIESCKETISLGATGFLVNFDWTVYAYNSYARQTLKKLGANILTFPIELTVYDMIKNPASELVVYGYIPVMVSANCVKKTNNVCDKKPSVVLLKDRKGENLRVKSYCKYCYTQIFNTYPLYLMDLKELEKLQIESVRYDFSFESVNEIENIFNGIIPKNFTRGHFLKGIE